MARARLACLAGIAIACSAPARTPGAAGPAPSAAPHGATTPRKATAAGVPVRVMLARIDREARVGATGAWSASGDDGAPLARGGALERWRVERSARRLRLVRDDGQATAWADSPIIIRTADADAFPIWNEKRYRGELALSASDSGVTVVNRLPLESYLRGVVALEMGDRPATDMAALEAQAVAARSYAVARLRATGERAWDLGVTVSDQVYGGVDAERALANAAVAATEGEMLTYAGRVVSAPFHSTCGGSTAEPTEVWRGAQEPHLARVSDRIPGTDRYYCDIAPRFRWERTFDRTQIDRLLERYLRRYSSAPDGALGTTRRVSIDGTTPSGRAAAVVFTTTRGTYRVRGNDARYILRSPGGELLNSAYFLLDATAASDGSLARLVIRGRGYGHGVGMCQWGAIGRARAGQSYRQILSAYYPGTTIERAE